MPPPSAKKRAEINRATAKQRVASPKPSGAGLFKCPAGHPLPHRVPKLGRCTEFECCLARAGAHSQLRRALNSEKSEIRAYAEETEYLLEQRGRMAAWDKIHPLPKITAPPEMNPTDSVHKYLRARAAQAAPLALERVIRRALLMPGAAGDAAADNILDRVGFSRKTEPTVENNGPVFIVNFDRARVPLLNQPASGQHVVDGEYTTQQAAQGDESGQPVSGEAERRARVASGEGDDHS